MPKIGAHVSAAGGIDKAPDRAKELGLDCFQLFASPPRQFVVPEIAKERKADFKKKVEKHKLGPNFFHAIYLLNFASEKKFLAESAIRAVGDYQKIAAETGVAGTIFHTGSHQGRGFEAVFDQIVKAFKEILKETPEGPRLIIEGAAGAGGVVAKSLEEIALLIDRVNSKRMAVCLDTAHLFASGVPIQTQEGLESLIKDFKRLIGLDMLVALHLNDSKAAFLSNKDRHENIGEGEIGGLAIGRIVNHRAFRELPMILEVPGFDGQGPDKKNVEIVRRLID